MNGKQTKKMRKYARQTFKQLNTERMSGALWQDFFIVVSRLCLKSRIRLALMIVFRKRIGK